MERRDFLKAGVISLGAMAIADSAAALKYYPKKSDKKWAVIYSTWCGSSRDAGVWISEGMGGIADVFDVRENPDLSAHDHIVVGGSIRSNEVSKEMQDYLTKNKELLKGKIRGYFCVQGNMKRPVGPENVQQLIDGHLARLTSVTGVPGRCFNGRITLGLLEPGELKMMNEMGMQDYDFMKRSDFLEYGKSILESVK
ncbi:MAG: hypothetical protein GX846_11085 [Deltaproteobacteria bacterium]|nr:hypothetical protein [Deltaproteobacteria bacterium]